MQIGLIWAQAQNGVIGINGQLPWHLPEDLTHFKLTTMGAPVIMGRKTWDSLPVRFRPLPGRQNIVISRQPHLPLPEGVLHAVSLDAALDFLNNQATEKVWVIGGAQLYAAAMPLADELSVTFIDRNFDGDAVAPKIDGTWSLLREQKHVASHDNASLAGTSYRFVSYSKIKTN